MSAITKVISVALLWYNSNASFDPKIVMNSFNRGALAYLLKPLDAKKLKQELHSIGFSA
jgi:response regulator of citrate/malate metabolism